MWITIASGPDFNFQYYAFVLIGLPFLFFKDEIGKRRLLFSLLPLLVFVFLEFNYCFFDRAVVIKGVNASLFGIINNLVSFFMSFIIFYFIYNENNNYLKALQTQTIEVEEKNKQLEHFAYIAAHDLNEPLRTVTSFIDIVKEEYEDVNDDKLKPYFSYIKKAITRMRAMIDSLLDYSRIGKFEKIETINTKDLITKIVSDLSKEIKVKEAEICFKALPNITLSTDERNCLIIKAPQLNNDTIITNDVVELKTYKKFVWKGRHDNVINTGGIKLFPEEIENRLQLLIGDRFFVAGIPDDSLGDKLILVIESEYDKIAKLSLMEDLTHIKSLSKYEIPKEIYFLPQFIETDTSKIQRKKTLDLLFEVRY